MDRVQLSPDFYLDEFTRSETAARHGIAVDIAVGSAEYANVQRLVVTVLQPARAVIWARPVSVTSGFRPEPLNRLIGGSPTSDHCTASAADVWLPGDLLEAARAVEAAGLPFKQLIYEFGKWIHLSVPGKGEESRRQVLTAYRSGGRVVYVPGLHRIEDLERAAA
ncbi:MAG: D-Ala-D-Ala carboxypeptidase family metallohydrolase [Desulfovibrionaceae bacterium]